MLKIEDLSLSYERQGKKQVVLCDFDLTLQQGEIVAVIGPSGCGKSSLLHCIAGIHPIDKGCLLLGEETLDHQKQMIGFMPQGYGLLPWKNVLENCKLPYKVKHLPFDAEAETYLMHLLDHLEIAHLKKRYPAYLSGGQKQRVALARTLACKPQLLLLDEPFSALDAIMKEEAQTAFLELWRERACSTLVVTHSIEEALYLGKRIIVMGGRPSGIIFDKENPFFGKQEEHGDPSYQEWMQCLKQKIKEGWQSGKTQDEL